MGFRKIKNKQSKNILVACGIGILDRGSCEILHLQTNKKLKICKNIYY